MRTLLLGTFAACILYISPTVSSGDNTGARPPNIVLIVCDNLGYGDVEPFNPDCLNRTPNLNRMGHGLSQAGPWPNPEAAESYQLQASTTRRLIARSQLRAIDQNPLRLNP